MRTLLNSLKTLVTVALITSLFSCEMQESVEKKSAAKQSGELSVEEARKLAFSSDAPNSNERALIKKSEEKAYDFSATFTDGAGAGTSISGVLNIKTRAVVSVAASPTIFFKGSLTTSDGTSIPVGGNFGGVNGPDAIRIVFFLANEQIIVGNGFIASDGSVKGNFELQEQGSTGLVTIGGGTWTATPKIKEVKPTGPTIVDIAAGDPRFSTLVSALKATPGLVELLSGSGTARTVFAPTNDAFAALSALPEGDALRQVLLYHIVGSGRFTAADLLKTSEIVTNQGDVIKVTTTAEGEVILNGVVKVIIADIEASNGIIHVIDAVLIPPATTKK